jgi:hypothetical protein
VSGCLVFTGPTLAPEAVSAVVPQARVLPPVRHGDLLRLDVGAGDTVLIIDGLFLQTASVRHREILYLLQRGMTVAGSSSMGALRAAELWQYGMRGFGEVFRLYRDGEIDGDDEVAIVHGTADDGYQSYSDPLVSIRIAVRDAARDAVISAADARVLLELAVGLPFRSRSFRRLDLVAAEHVSAASVEAFRTWRATRDTDAKAVDARLMLSAFADGDPELRPAGPGDLPIRNVHTRIFDVWQNRFHGSEADGEWVADADADNVIRVAHPAFRDAHRRQVLSWIAGLDPGHPALVERAIAAARAGGLCGGDPDVSASDDPSAGPDLSVARDRSDAWLMPGEFGQSADELLVTLLVRAFGAARGRYRTKWDMPTELRTKATRDWACQFAVDARVAHEALLGPAEGPPRKLKPQAVDQSIADLWGCDIADLQAQAWDRGIADLATLREIAQPLVAYIRFGEPGPPPPIG